MSFSEFAGFVSDRSGVRRPLLVGWDVALHSLLTGLMSRREFSGRYLLKGGTCLAKCYLDYHRFSVDLDFTYAKREDWERLNKRERRGAWVGEARRIAGLLSDVIKELNSELGLGLEFKPDITDERFAKFGSGSRLVTFKLYREGRLIKVEVNLDEPLLFEPRWVRAKTLLSSRGVEVSPADEAYFREFLARYRDVEVWAYDPREVLCEKVRALITRRAPRLRDLYDLMELNRRLRLRVEDHVEEISEKVESAERFERYREGLRGALRWLERRDYGWVESEEEWRLLTQADVEGLVEEARSFLEELAPLLEDLARKFL